MSVTGRPLSKGHLALVRDGAVVEEFTFQFNPTERSRSHEVMYNFTSPPGSSLPIASFGSISGPAWGMTFLLDATENYSDAQEGVRAQKAFFESLVQPDRPHYIEHLSTFTAPPEVIYQMGEEMWRVLVTSVHFTDTRFNRKGYETRCEVQLDMQLYFTSPEHIKLRLQRLHQLRSMVVHKKGGTA